MHCEQLQDIRNIVVFSELIYKEINPVEGLSLIRSDLFTGEDNQFWYRGNRLYRFYQVNPESQLCLHVHNDCVRPHPAQESKGADGVLCLPDYLDIGKRQDKFPEPPEKEGGLFDYKNLKFFHAVPPLDGILAAQD